MRSPDKISDNDQVSDYNLVRDRSKRKRVDRTGVKATLERLRECKNSGETYTPQLTEDNSIYVEVDEREYSKIVQERQNDDWIVDDGSGYVEDGREIFDDDLYDERENRRTKNLKKNKVGVSSNPNIRASNSKAASIKSMFAAAATKPQKKQEVIPQGEDEFLNSIMEELNSSDIVQPSPVRLLKRPTGRSCFGSRTQESSAIDFMPSPKPQRISSVDTNPSSPSTGSFLRRKVVNFPKIKPQEEKLSLPEEKPHMTQDVGSQDLFDDDDDEMMGEIPMPSACDSAVPEKKTTEIEAAFNDDSCDDELLASSMCWSETVSDDTQPSNQSVGAPSQVPLNVDSNGNKVLRMYWLDAYEDYFKHPGVVYLFGKVWIDAQRGHVSCCVVVKDVKRRVFLLPRTHRKINGQPTDQSVGILDVYQEFKDGITTKYDIKTFQSRPCKKMYAFEKDNVPVESDYLEVKYPAGDSVLPSNLEGETFSHVFGTTTTSLEILIINRRLRGPCWIEIKNPEFISNPSSWCVVEASVSKFEQDISVSAEQTPPPPLVVMSLSLQTYTNPSKENEILGISMLINNKYPLDKPPPKVPFQQNFCAICKPANCVFPFDLKENLKSKMNKVNVEIIGNERSLLTLLISKMNKIDPDIVMGHDITSFDLDVLIHRLQVCKVSNWSKIGRLRRAQYVKFGGGVRNVSSFCAGRILCDIQISARELIRCRSYDLTELVSHILKEKRSEMDYISNVASLYSSSAKLAEMASHGMSNAAYVFKIMCELNVLPLALQITNICGNVMARSLLGGRSERNEYLLLHAFNDKNFIVPDKVFSKKNITNEDDDDENPKKGGKKKPAYTGGLVLEPKRGFYDHFILLLDFNSLYPSIIQEYNICFTTVDLTNNKGDKKDGAADEEYDESLLPERGVEPGILPTEIRKLVESRKQVRSLMKKSDVSQDLMMQYDIRQKALKLTANSMYGCLGFGSSRFCAKRLAALITGKGREILLKTKDLVQGMNVDVIYGDTDSIMINTGLRDIDEVMKLGNKIKAEVNRHYRLLEIDVDGIFKSMLLLKKKKYAALSVNRMPDGKIQTKQEMKGLDIVRRDWCQLAKDVGEHILKQIFSGESRDTIVENIHEKLREVAQSASEGKISRDKYSITKQLTKSPEEYRDKDSLPHVQVAARLNLTNGKKLKAGDIIHYVICLNGTEDAPTKRGYHPDELNKSDSLTIDINYYLSQQVHPVVSRLCDPIEGTDACRIADCLGLDAKSYRQPASKREFSEEDAMLGATMFHDEDKYVDCEKFAVSCPKCRQINTASVPYIDFKNNLVQPSLYECSNPACKEILLDHATVLKNRLHVSVGNYVKKYYAGWMTCEDVCCNHRTRKMPIRFKNGHVVCPACGRNPLKLEYTEKCLYLQLNYLQSIFDVDNLPKNKSLRPIGKEAMDQMKMMKYFLDQKLKRSAYGEVDLSKLFATLMGK